MMRKSAYDQTLSLFSFQFGLILVICLSSCLFRILFGHLVLVLFDVCLRCLLIQSNIKGWLFSSEKKANTSA